MKKILFLQLILMFATFYSISQTATINTDQTNSNGRVIVGVKSSANGGLPPRVTAVQQSLLASSGTGLLVDSLGNILARGTYSGFHNRLPMQGPGTRMMWIPNYAAFRVGTANNTQWDSANIGTNSFAGGLDCIASKDGSFAYGSGCSVTSVVGTAFGSDQVVTGTGGFTSGASNTVFGFCGTSLGFGNRANAQGSVAIGYRTSATSSFSVALGYRATNAGYQGGLVLGGFDGTTDSVQNTATAEMAARYTGGYRFYTKSDMTLGVSLGHNGTAWVSISDSTKKEKFVKADPSAFLDKLAKLKLGSWNYKGTDAVGDRHYGPMAQEIFAAYGKDKIGKIGCDTTLSTLDMDGIMMILLQGLEKRTSDQMAKIKDLSEELVSVKTENTALKNQLAKVEVIQQQILALQQSMENRKVTGATNATAAIVPIITNDLIK